MFTMPAEIDLPCAGLATQVAGLIENKVLSNVMSLPVAATTKPPVDTSIVAAISTVLPARPNPVPRPITTLTGVGVIVGVSLGVGVDVDVGVSVGVAVGVDVGVSVGVLVGVLVAVVVGV